MKEATKEPAQKSTLENLSNDSSSIKSNDEKSKHDKGFYRERIAIGHQYLEKDTTYLGIGYDTEYDVVEMDGKTFSRGITAQLSIFGNWKDKITDSDLLSCVYFPVFDISSFVFAIPEGSKNKREYHLWLESKIEILSKMMEDEYPHQAVRLLTFYSNAELSLHFSNRGDLAGLVHEKNIKWEQSDRGKKYQEFIDIRNSRRLDKSEYKHFKDLENEKRDLIKVIPIQGVAAIKGMNLNSSLNIDLIDIRLLCGGGSLAALGESLGFSKGDCDFSKHSASWFLENDRENFLDYAARDSAISLYYYEIFINGLNEIFDKCEDRKLIKPSKSGKDSETVGDAERLKGKTFLTAASITDALMKRNLGFSNKYQDYKKFNEIMADRIPPRFLYQNKGGLNKSSHGWQPAILKNIDGYDIKSAYATAMMRTKMPLIAPSKFQILNDGEGLRSTLKNLAERLDKYPVAFCQIEYIKLPEGTPENHRIINLYDNKGECATALSNDWIPQMFSHYEIQAQAILTPKAEVVVSRIYGWDKKLMSHESNYVNFGELFKFLAFECRNEFKKQYGDKSIQQNTAKLLGNGGVGKLAQCKEGFNGDLLIETLSRGGEISSILKESFKSECYNPLFFNLITATVRSVLGVSYGLSDGIMCVTDSVACPTGQFQDSKSISEKLKNGGVNGCKFKQLAEVLSWFDWEKERENATLQIYKERDYAFLKGSDSDIDNLKKKLSEGIATNEDLKDIKIEKIAKRGYHQDKSMSKREQGEDFVLLGNERFSGRPIKQKNAKLTKFIDMLNNPEKNLNSPYINGQDSAGMGSFNLKYNLSGLKELDHRRRVKEICRINGYADQLHLMNSSEFHLLAVYEKRANCRKIGNYKDFMPDVYRQILGLINFYNIKSSRELEKLTGIGKSSINRFSKGIKQSEIPEQILEDVVIEIFKLKDEFSNRLKTDKYGCTDRRAAEMLSEILYEWDRKLLFDSLLKAFFKWKDNHEKYHKDRSFNLDDYPMMSEIKDDSLSASLKT